MLKTFTKYLCFQEVTTTAKLAHFSSYLSKQKQKSHQVYDRNDGRPEYTSKTSTLGSSISRVVTVRLLVSKT